MVDQQDEQNLNEQPPISARGVFERIFKVLRRYYERLVVTRHIRTDARGSV